MQLTLRSLLEFSKQNGHLRLHLLEIFPCEKLTEKEYQMKILLIATSLLLLGACTATVQPTFVAQRPYQVTPTSIDYSHQGYNYMPQSQYYVNHHIVYEQNRGNQRWYPKRYDWKHPSYPVTHR